MSSADLKKQREEAEKALKKIEKQEKDQRKQTKKEKKANEKEKKQEKREKKEVKEAKKKEDREVRGREAVRDLKGKVGYSSTFSMEQDQSELRLRILIQRAVNLQAGDSNGLSDPYVVVSAQCLVAKTKVIPKTLNPTWNEFFDLGIHETDVAKGNITIEVFDKDKVGSESLGSADIPLKDLKKQRSQYQIPLTGGVEKKNKGVIEVVAQLATLKELEAPPAKAEKPAGEEAARNVPLAGPPVTVLATGVVLPPNVYAPGSPVPVAICPAPPALEQYAPAPGGNAASPYISGSFTPPPLSSYGSNPSLYPPTADYSAQTTYTTVQTQYVVQPPNQYGSQTNIYAAQPGYPAGYPPAGFPPAASTPGYPPNPASGYPPAGYPATSSYGSLPGYGSGYPPAGYPSTPGYPPVV